MRKLIKAITQGTALLLICGILFNEPVAARGFGGGRTFNRDDMRGDDFGGFRGQDLRGGGFGRFGGLGGGFADRRGFANDNRAGDMSERALATDGGFGRLAQHPNLQQFHHLGNNTYNFNRSTLVNNGDLVRHNFNNFGAFDRGWWGAHPGCWYAAGWPAGYCWGNTSWEVMAPFLGLSSGMMLGMGMGTLASGNGNTTTAATSPPVEYDYSNSIVYDGANVYYGSQPLASASDYYDQACNLARSGYTAPSPVPPKTAMPAKMAEWKPFGVFSLVQKGQSDSTALFQVAVNKDGVIRGNYYNSLTDETKAISGAIDKKSMRACWTVDGVKNVVYDTGVGNLMEPQSPILVHFGKDRTDQFMLVRLQQGQGVPQQG